LLKPPFHRLKYVVSVLPLSLVGAQVAIPSLTQRPFQSAGATASPYHWWTSSWTNVFWPMFWEKYGRSWVSSA
jgi:hypothetical protein